MSTAVLLMAHGTPSSLDDLPEYLTRVREGRPASEELVAEIRRNYSAIGGRSPLTDITFRQRDALSQRLGGAVPVVVGMRHWDPFISEALGRLAGLDGYDVAFQSAGRTPEPWIGPELNAMIRERAAAGIRRVLVVPIGFVSDHTEILYDLDVQAAATAADCSVQFRRTPSLNESEEFISLLEELVRSALGVHVQFV